jgi:type I restriction enzyme R subunit
VFVSTYPTMMGLINDATRDGVRRFGVGAFDLVVIDEAHRSVFQKYRAIFEYFDALLVGLTATPRDEVDRNTYDLFHLETGVPTDVYELDDAVKDGYLVPPLAVSVPLKFQREGITYGDLSEEEQEQWDQLEWDEEGEVPERVEPEAVNRWLFNQDTVDRVLEHLMRHGVTVAGGDRMGKTIVFAKNQAHAEFIAERFNTNYPHYRGEFARIITFKTEYAQSLIEDFGQKDKAPHIAISVDMLDTGIDVPEVVNLVFFKMVRSKTKFWQMLGRGTRLCEDLFGPGEDKEFFRIFDFCQNLEFFSSEIGLREPTVGPSLRKKLFLTRLELIGELDRTRPALPDGVIEAVDPPTPYVAASGEPLDEKRLRSFLAYLLHDEVARMNLDNFIVRPHRRAVERFARPDAWRRLTPEDVVELTGEVAGLPSQQEAQEEEARRFDLLLLRMQLSLLRSDPGFATQMEAVRGLATLLIEKSSIPMVAAQMRWIEDLLDDTWWENVTLPMLEQVRLRLRGLLALIEKRNRRIVYSNFIDEVGPQKVVSLPGIPTGFDIERFRSKARAFLRSHLDHIAVHKVRMGEPLTATDLAELERILVDSDVGSTEEVQLAQEQAHGLGVFVRSLVGLDREAAKRAFSGFLASRPLRADQIEFVDMIVNSLTERGIMDAAQLYESPFTDISPRGPEQLFSPSQLDELESILAGILRTAGT